MEKRIFCTIVTDDYIAPALVLRDSLRTHAAGVRLVILAVGSSLSATLASKVWTHDCDSSEIIGISDLMDSTLTHQVVKAYVEGNRPTDDGFFHLAGAVVTN